MTETSYFKNQACYPGAEVVLEETLVVDVELVLFDPAAAVVVVADFA